MLLDPLGGTASRYEDENYHVPAVENYPALLVRGDLRCRMNSTLLGEGTGLNFNPPGNPYPWPSGVTDSDTTDTYPNEIRGLIYISGDFQIQTAATLGQVVVGGSITYKNGDYSLNYNPLYYSNPPPGFSLIKMVPARGAGGKSRTESPRKSMDRTTGKPGPTALRCAGARRPHRPRWKQHAGELVTPYGDRMVHKSRTPI